MTRPSTPENVTSGGPQKKPRFAPSYRPCRGIRLIANSRDQSLVHDGPIGFWCIYSRNGPHYLDKPLYRGWLFYSDRLGRPHIPFQECSSCHIAVTRPGESSAKPSTVLGETSRNCNGLAGEFIFIFRIAVKRRGVGGAGHPVTQILLQQAPFLIKNEIGIDVLSFLSWKNPAWQ